MNICRQLLRPWEYKEITKYTLSIHAYDRNKENIAFFTCNKHDRKTCCRESFGYFRFAGALLKQFHKTTSLPLNNPDNNVNTKTDQQRQECQVLVEINHHLVTCESSSAS